ncbi:MAG: cache domain-containing protein [Proteobacteria bacterium]|nr:cache domain-containing protein [Pseudomonadota bacterium]MBU0965321.1 cache domain-containing protein [Pseudomonadota bacterium]
MFNLNNLKLSFRMLFIGLIVVITFTGILVAGYFGLKYEKYAAKNVKTQQVVETAWGVIDHYAKLSSAGTISEEQAQSAAKDTIRNMRYDQNEYFFINNTSGISIMHPMKPELEGQDLSGMPDTNGKKLFAEMADICRQNGSGFVDYYWEKPGEKQPSPKISFVKLHPAWNWFVGSGIYVDDVQQEMARTFWVMLIGGSSLLSTLMLLGFFVTRSIVKPINQITDELNQAAVTVADASSQVSSSSQILAEGTSEQAAALEETSSSLEELSSMTKQNAGNAREVNALMTETKNVVSRSNESMAELTVSMHDIATASEETQKIIKTIDEIAFQTNLLSLNAAVEAARAGEAGAGFAVVADEVRNLAMRASEAAKNTSEMIEKSVNRIHHGAELVKKCNADFAEVSQGAEKVHKLVNEIATAAAEQAQGINQISTAVSEMDSVTQTNAANAEESAAASEELNVLSVQLNDTVKRLGKIVSGNIDETRTAQTHSLHKNSAQKAGRPSKRLGAPGKTKNTDAWDYQNF